MGDKSVTVLQERVVKDDDSSEETSNASCHLALRQELDALRAKRKKEAKDRSNELERLECLFRTSKERLQRKLLSERSNQATYRQFLQEHQQQLQSDRKGTKNNTSSDSTNIMKSYTVAPTSNYIIQQEASLFSTMHRSFCVLPHQIEVMEREYERDIYPYFRQEIQSRQLELLEVSNNWMNRLSVLAEGNNALYDSYQDKLDQIKIEVREHKKKLLTQTAEETTTSKGINKNDDETSITSVTDHSSDCDDDDSEHIISPKQEEGGGGLLKVARLLLTPTTTPIAVKTSLSSSSSPSSSSMGNLSDSIHEHIYKGGIIFQMAAKQFRLPFTSEDGSADHDDSTITKHARRE